MARARPKADLCCRRTGVNFLMDAAHPWSHEKRFALVQDVRVWAGTGGSASAALLVCWISLALPKFHSPVAGFLLMGLRLIKAIEHGPTFSGDSMIAGRVAWAATLCYTSNRFFS